MLLALLDDLDDIYIDIDMYVYTHTHKHAQIGEHFLNRSRRVIPNLQVQTTALFSIILSYYSIAVLDY